LTVIEQGEGRAVTREQAEQLRQAYRLLDVLGDEHGSQAWGEHERGEAHGRAAVWARVAADAIRSYLICEKVNCKDDNAGRAVDTLHDEDEPEPDGDVSDVSIYGAGVK